MKVKLDQILSNPNEKKTKTEHIFISVLSQRGRISTDDGSFYRNLSRSEELG